MRDGLHRRGGNGAVHRGDGDLPRAPHHARPRPPRDRHRARRDDPRCGAGGGCRLRRLRSSRRNGDHRQALSRRDVAAGGLRHIAACAAAAGRARRRHTGAPFRDRLRDPHCDQFSGPDPGGHSDPTRGVLALVPRHGRGGDRRDHLASRPRQGWPAAGAGRGLSDAAVVCACRGFRAVEAPSGWASI